MCREIKSGLLYIRVFTENFLDLALGDVPNEDSAVSGPRHHILAVRTVTKHTAVDVVSFQHTTH